MGTPPLSPRGTPSSFSTPQSGSSGTNNTIAPPRLGGHRQAQATTTTTNNSLAPSTPRGQRLGTDVSNDTATVQLQSTQRGRSGARGMSALKADLNALSLTMVGDKDIKPVDFKGFVAEYKKANQETLQKATTLTENYISDTKNSWKILKDKKTTDETKQYMIGFLNVCRNDYVTKMAEYYAVAVTDRDKAKLLKLKEEALNI